MGAVLAHHASNYDDCERRPQNAYEFLAVRLSGAFSAGGG